MSSFLLGLLLVNGLHIASGAIHSWKAFYTGASGLTEFPEFVALNLVDDQLMGYFDSKTNHFKSQFQWMADNLGEAYDERQTNILKGHEATFKNSVRIVMERFNQTQGVHTVQNMFGCQWDDETGAIDAFDQYGYDGEDLVSLDFKEFRYISPVPQGVPSAQKWNNDRGMIEGNKNYFSTVCIDWLKKYLEYGKSSLQKTAPPEVSVLQKSSSVSCHATGFYPSGVTITWKKNGEEHHEDVDLGQLLPNADGTFQKTSTLRVSSEELKNNKFSCEVEHQGKTTSRSPADPFPMGIILGVVGALVLCLIIAGVGILLWKKKSGFKPVSGSDDGSSNHSSPEATQA